MCGPGIEWRPSLRHCHYSVHSPDEPVVCLDEGCWWRRLGSGGRMRWRPAAIMSVAGLSLDRTIVQCGDSARKQADKQYYYAVTAHIG